MSTPKSMVPPLYCKGTTVDKNELQLTLSQFLHSGSRERHMDS